VKVLEDGQVRNLVELEKVKTAEKEKQTLEKELQTRLWKKTYDFGETDDVVEKEYRGREERMAVKQAESEEAKPAKQAKLDDVKGEEENGDARQASLKEVQGEMEVVTEEDEKSVEPRSKKVIDWRGKTYLAPLTTVKAPTMTPKGNDGI